MKNINNNKVFSWFLVILLLYTTVPFIKAEDNQVKKINWQDTKNKIPESIFIYPFEDEIIKKIQDKSTGEFIHSIYQLDSNNKYYLLKKDISPQEDIKIRSIFQNIGFLPPLDVEVGIYISKLYNMSLPENEICTEFYLWFNHKNDIPNPSDDIPVKNFSLMNSKEYTQLTEPYERWVDAKKEISSWRTKANAVIMKNWDTSNFPFDKHKVEILIESEYGIDCFNYLPDKKDSMIYDKVKINGWEIKDFNVTTDSEELEGGWGYHGFYRFPPFPRFIASFTLVREGGGWGSFMKIFSGLFIAFLMCFVSMIIKSDYIDAKFALSIGALFIVLASQYVVGSVLPDTPSQTYADVIHNIAYLFVFLVVAESIYSKYLFDKENEQLARKVDLISLIVFFAGLVISIAILTINALNT